MNLLQQKFKALAGKKALIPFITAGHPKPEMTVPIMHELVKNGADILELGMPFSRSNGRWSSDSNGIRTSD